MGEKKQRGEGDDIEEGDHRVEGKCLMVNQCMVQVPSTPYTWGLRLQIFSDTQTHRLTDSQTGGLFI